ncbi:hypothetical protein VHEMI10732 [[Torrubiella] hemipterigena]|uniref:SNF2 N-terminal domain-containing protein n=1 Tax=[Torrubiella] hemipterigena TaxID=1531966 RepID=A0A0A1TE09_9HYPO|nr:hypothetical protein VHEMI10732 [[Torrubiella] hemipterigena]
MKVPQDLIVKPASDVNVTLSPSASSGCIDLTDVSDDGPQADKVSLLQDSVRSNLVQHCYTQLSEVNSVARFFAVTHQQLLDGIQLPGTSKVLRHYQLEAIFNFFQRASQASSNDRNKSRHGSLLCDETGLGKSYCALGVQAVTRLIYIALDDISNHPTRHNQDNIIDIEDMNQQCPSGRAFGIECPCMPGSQSKAYARTLNGGATFMIVPAHLVQESQTKSKQFFEPTTRTTAEPLCEVLVYESASMLVRYEPGLHTDGPAQHETVDPHAIHAVLPAMGTFKSAPATKRRDWESWTEMVADCGPQTTPAPPPPRTISARW